MTTVGYGDGVSMPDFEDYQQDYWVMAIHIMASVFAFYMCQAALIAFLENISTV